MNNWINFTEDTLPQHGSDFLLMYKDLLWKSERYTEDITGISPSGEIKLYTSISRILEHDKENGDQTKWKPL